MTIARTFDIPQLATVKLDTTDPKTPTLEIILSPDYDGDLREIALQSEGSDDVYLRCDHVTALANLRLNTFMETLAHHDYTGDGKPDCGEIIKAIEDALYQTRETPLRFRRPVNGPYSKLVMSMMPKQPDDHIVMGYGKLQPRMRLHHHLVGILMIGVFFGLVYLQELIAPWTKYSVVTGSMAIAEAIGLTWWMGLLAFIVIGFLMQRFGKQDDAGDSPMSRYTVGFFSKAAVFEEQIYREGSENWNFQQRVRSCVAFGLIHMVNLIYPLATILPLALGGAFFMAMYLRKFRQTQSRRAAVLRASVWHRVYNRVALTVLVLWLLVSLGYGALHLFVAGAVLFGLGAAFDYVVNQRQPEKDLSTTEVALYK